MMQERRFNCCPLAPADGPTPASSALANGLGLSTGLQICSKAFGFFESLEIVRMRLASKIDIREERLK